MSRSDAEAAFAGGDDEMVREALLSVTYYGTDRRWVQDQCLRLAQGDNPQTQTLAVTCLGHLARIHKTLDLEKALPVLDALSEDPKVRGRVEDALDDIEMFTEWNGRRSRTGGEIQRGG